MMHRDHGGRIGPFAEQRIEARQPLAAGHAPAARRIGRVVQHQAHRTEINGVLDEGVGSGGRAAPDPGHGASTRED